MDILGHMADHVTELLGENILESQDKNHMDPPVVTEESKQVLGPISDQETDILPENQQTEVKSDLGQLDTEILPENNDPKNRDGSD